MWLLHVLGIDSVSGRWYGFWSGFGSDLAIIGAVVASGWAVVRRMVAHHKASLSQAERHHAERMVQALAHHNELKHQAERHHEQRLDAQFTAMKQAADAQVNAGAGGNPAEGLAADQRVVPPAAVKARIRRAPKAAS